MKEGNAMDVFGEIKETGMRLNSEEKRKDYQLKLFTGMVNDGYINDLGGQLNVYFYLITKTTNAFEDSAGQIWYLVYGGKDSRIVGEMASYFHIRETGVRYHLEELQKKRYIQFSSTKGKGTRIALRKIPKAYERKELDKKLPFSSKTGQLKLPPFSSKTGVHSSKTGVHSSKTGVHSSKTGELSKNPKIELANKNKGKTAFEPPKKPQIPAQGNYVSNYSNKDVSEQEKAEAVLEEKNPTSTTASSSFQNPKEGGKTEKGTVSNTTAPIEGAVSTAAVYRYSSFKEADNPEFKGYLQKAFPMVDVEKSFREADTWVRTHPNRKKKNYARFCRNWVKTDAEDIIRDRPQTKEPEVDPGRFDDNLPERPELTAAEIEEIHKDAERVKREINENRRRQALPSETQRQKRRAEDRFNWMSGGK